MWIDAFHAGIRSPDEVRQLVADATRIHVNTLIVQVRRRGDALYAGGIEPPLDDPNYDPSFDALAAVITAAHAAGLQVRAWINAMPVWRDEAPPKDPRHVFNQHGPAAAGEACWLTGGRDGAALEGRTVRIRRAGWFRRTMKTTTDANGWFGMTKLAPGRYGVELEDANGRALPDRVEVVVAPGRVARAALDSKGRAVRY